MSTFAVLGIPLALGREVAFCEPQGHRARVPRPALGLYGDHRLLVSALLNHFKRGAGPQAYLIIFWIETHHSPGSALTLGITSKY